MPFPRSLTKLSKSALSTTGISSSLSTFNPRVYPSSRVHEPQISSTYHPRTVSRLAFENCPWPLPESVNQGLIENVHQKHMLPPHGLPELRWAAATLYSNETGLEYNAKNISISSGTNNNVFHLQSAFDADLIIPSPSTDPYTFQPQWNGHKMRWIHTSKDNGYKLTAEQLYHVESFPVLHIMDQEIF